MVALTTALQIGLHLERIARGTDARSGAERLEPDAAAEEAFALALRARAGVVPHEAAQPTVDLLVAAGMLERRDTVVVLTRSGRLLASDVTARLLLAGAAKPTDNAGRT